MSTMQPVQDVYHCLTFIPACKEKKLTCFTADRACCFHMSVIKLFHSGCAGIDAVDAETNETPVRSFKVARNHQGKLFLDGIEKALANRGLVLLGIGEDVFPAHKDGWTMNTFNASPVQLLVGPKPGMDTTYGSGVCM